MTERDVIHAGWAAWDDGPRVSFSTQWLTDGQSVRAQVTARSSLSLTLGTFDPGWLLADTRKAGERLSQLTAW